MEILGNKNGAKKGLFQYVCDKCDYKCSNKTKYGRHLTTAKHGQEIKKEQKKGLLFFCKKCDVECSSRYNFERHLSTQKHLEIKEEQMEQKKGLFCQICSKKFTSSSGLWKHAKLCVSCKPEINTELILEIIKQNQEFKQLLLEHTSKAVQTNAIATVNDLNINHNNNNNNNAINSHNKTFNLQVFLNETCKDAMNITDFVNSIQLQLSDFERIGEEGYINGISNIIIKNLKAIDEHLRPVHCSDVKRETIYIRDNNQWQKDTDDNHNLKKVIRAIAHKNTKMMPKYREKYPETQVGTSKASDNYSRFVIEALGGPGDNNDEKADKIVRRIAKEIAIHKE